MMKRHSVVLACILILSLGLSGCTALPKYSEAQVVGKYEPSRRVTPAPQPVQGQDPDITIRDFLRALALPDQQHSAAKEFLTENAKKRWKDSTQTTIVSRIDLNVETEPSSSQATFKMRGRKVGLLRDGGIYATAKGQVDDEIVLVKENDMWLIDSLPNGVVIERSAFFANYSAHNLYFLNPQGTALVADQRWTGSTEENLPYVLVNLLAAGPRPSLVRGVSNEVPESLVARPGTGDSEEASGITIDLKGIEPASSTQREQMLAQLVWTLAVSDLTGPYRFERDGEPLDSDHAAGWSIQDVTEFSPTVLRPSSFLVVSAEKKLLSVQGDSVAQAQGKWGKVRNISQASLSADARFLAAIRQSSSDSTEEELIVGRAGENYRVLTTAQSITSPTWHSVDNSVWFVKDGTTIVRISGFDRGQELVETVIGLTIPSRDTEISHIRLSPSGSRIAMIVGQSLFLATLTGQEAGAPEIESIIPLGAASNEVINTVEWFNRSTLIVGRDSAESPVFKISSDGAVQENLPARNISRSVSHIALLADRILATDSRAMLQLSTSEKTSEGFWREVSGFFGQRGIPVVSS